MLKIEIFYQHCYFIINIYLYVKIEVKKIEVFMCKFENCNSKQTNSVNKIIQG